MKKIWFLGASFFLSLLAGCMNQPLNGQTLPNYDSQIKFEGKVLGLPSHIQIMSYGANADGTAFTNDSGFIMAFDAEPSPLPDAAGKQWYHWGGTMVLAGYYDGMPGTLDWKQTWVQVPGKRQLQAKLWATVDKTNKFATFDLSKEAADCYNAHQSEGVMAVIQNCASKDMGVVIVYAPCGAKDQGCCRDGTPCDSNMLCSGEGKCGAYTLEGGPPPASLPVSKCGTGYTWDPTTLQCIHATLQGVGQGHPSY